MKEQLALQNILRDRYASMQARNPAFSVRSFAKKLNISAGTLSLVLLGKRKVSKKLAKKISEHLHLDPHERSELIGQFQTAKNHDSIGANYLQLSADQFQMVSDWHYFALLNLITTKGFRNDVAWIAVRLGLSKAKIVDAIDRLKRLELIEENKKGVLKRTEARYRTTDDVVSIALRKSHHQTMDLAHDALDQVPLELRDFTWVTLPFDLKKIGQAKELIRKFQDDFRALLDEDASPDEVYRLAMQFFPLTQIKKETYKGV